MNLIKSKIEELESLMTNININTELDHSWCEIYKDLIDVLVVMHFSRKYKKLSKFSFDKERYFYYDVCMGYYTVNIHCAKKLHRVDKKINNTQKKFIVDILDSFDCATHID